MIYYPMPKLNSPQRSVDPVTASKWNWTKNVMGLENKSYYLEAGPTHDHMIIIENNSEPIALNKGTLRESNIAAHPDILYVLWIERNERRGES